MDFKFLVVFFLYYISAIKSSQDTELEIPASVRRALILNILNDLNILHDIPVRKSQFVGRKLNEARTDLSIQRAILDHVKPVQNNAPRFEKLVAPAPNGQARTPPKSLLNDFNLPRQRIKPPSFLQPTRKPPLGIGNPNQFVTRPDSVWAYMNMDNQKSTAEIPTTTVPSTIRTFQVSVNSPSIFAPPTFNFDAIDTQDQPTPTPITTASPVYRDPLANLFNNLLQNHNPIFRHDSDIQPPTAIDSPSAPIQMNSTANTGTINTEDVHDPFSHLMSNLMKIPGAFTNPLPGSPNSSGTESSNPEIASALVDPLVNSTDPMANLFSNLLNHHPTSFGLSNTDIAEVATTKPTTFNPLPGNTLATPVSPTNGFNNAFQNLPAWHFPTASPATFSPFPASPVTATPTTVSQDAILNSFIQPPPVFTATTPTPSPSIYHNHLPNWHHSGQTNTNTDPVSQVYPDSVPANFGIDFPKLPPTPTIVHDPLPTPQPSGPTMMPSTNIGTAGQIYPNTAPANFGIDFPNLPPTPTIVHSPASRPTMVPSNNDYQNYPNTVLTNHSNTAFQNLPSVNQSVPDSIHHSGPTMVHSTNIPERDATGPQVSPPNGHLQSPNITNALIQMFTAASEPPTEDTDLSDLEKLFSPPTVFALGTNGGTPASVANNGASVVDSQVPNPPPTAIPKPQNTFGSNGQMQIIPSVTPATVWPTAVVPQVPTTNVHPLISSIIQQNAGTNRPSAVQDKPTTPSPITPVHRPNPFFNARPVPGYPQVRIPPIQTTTQPTQTRPYYYFDPVTRQYRLSNQQVPPLPARPHPTTYPQPLTPTPQNVQNPPRQNTTQLQPRPYYYLDPITRQYRLSPPQRARPHPTTYPHPSTPTHNSQQSLTHHQGSTPNRYPGQHPTRYPNVNNHQQPPAGYRPPGYYYPHHSYTGTVHPTHTIQTTEAPEPVEPTEPPEPVEPEEPEETEEPSWPNWYYGGGSSSSSEED